MPSAKPARGKRAAEPPPEVPAKRTKPKPSDRLPWEELKRRYLASPTSSLRDFARREGLPRSGQFRKVVAREGWLQLWREAQAAATKAAAEVLVNQRAEAQAQCNAEMVQRADTLLQFLDEQRDNMVRGGLVQADTKELYALTRSYQRAFEIKRIGLGMPRDVIETNENVNVKVPTGLRLEVVPAPPPPPDEVWD